MTAAITDFGQFSSLRAGAEKDDPAVLREVAGQFEALFIQTMFKNMRDTSLADPVFGQSDQHEMYQEMLDKQYALEMSSGRGIGLADMLVRQLGGEITPVDAQAREFRLTAERYSGTPAGLTGVAGPEHFSTGLPHRSSAFSVSNAAIVDEGMSPGSFNSGQIGSVPTSTGRSGGAGNRLGRACHRTTGWQQQFQSVRHQGRP